MSQQGCSSPQACAKVLQSDTEKILSCRHRLCGHMPRFPGEDGCGEMFEHSQYFGELLSVLELTAMTAVNLKVERKEECKDSPRVMC